MRRFDGHTATAGRPAGGRGRHARRGAALIMVTWILMVLGVLAIEFASFMRDDAQAGINYSEEMAGYYVALAGMNQKLLHAIQYREASGGGPVQATGVPTEDDEELENPVDGTWKKGNFAGGEYEVRMTDETGKIPINKFPESVLRRVLFNVAVGGSSVQGINRREEAAVNEVVDSILDWRDPDGLTHPEGAESDYYLSLPRPYRAKNGFIESPEELLLIKGVTADLLYGDADRPGLRDVISVYNKTGVMNTRTMPAAVLQVLFGIDPTAAQELVAQRDTDPVTFQSFVEEEASKIDEQLAEKLEDTESHLLMVEARADVRTTRNRSSVAAVVELTSDDLDGIRVIRWIDRAPWTGVIPDPPAPEGAAG